MKKIFARFLIGIVALIIITVLILGAFISQLSFYRIPTVAMNPELQKGDLIIAEHFTPRFRKIHRGDIVIFESEKLKVNSQGIHDKRVVGLPGESIQILNGVLLINGKPINLYNSSGAISYHPHPQSTFLSTDRDTFQVPKDSYFVLGDNPANSFDSRFYGAVPSNAIIGRIVYRYSPASRVGFTN
jgi:signal peptidase I